MVGPAARPRPCSNTSEAPSIIWLFYWVTWVGCTSFSAAICCTVLRPLSASNAIRALNSALWILLLFFISLFGVSRPEHTPFPYDPTGSVSPRHLSFRPMGEQGVNLADLCLPNSSRGTRARLRRLFFTVATFREAPIRTWPHSSVHKLPLRPGSAACPVKIAPAKTHLPQTFGTCPTPDPT
jgi:hypothetical protein